MKPNRRTTAVALTGAVAVASAAYGLGTQTGDGSAAAGSQTRNGGPPATFERAAPPFSGEFAAELGVDAAELRQALRDFHESRRDAFAGALADALGISEERVSAAFDELREQRERRGSHRAPLPAPDGEPGACLAHRRAAMPLRRLAAALDVSRAELRKALGEIRPGGERGWKKHRDELAQFLADRFELDVEEVTDALAGLPRPGPVPHGGRPGPGGPGAFGP